MSNRLEETVARLLASGGSEDILVAEFAQDLPLELVEASMDEIASAAMTIKKTVTEPVLVIRRDDPVNIDPRRDWDNLGTMFCWHRRYVLGDHQPSGDSGLWIREYGPFFVQMPLYLYDHGGITMSTRPFACGWDSGQVGWIVVKAEDARREFGVKALNQHHRRKVIEILRHEVRAYDWYLTGQCWGYEYGDDSCWGFLGEKLEDTGLLEAIDAPREVIEAAWEERYG